MRAPETAEVPAPRRLALTRERILRAALDLIDQRGLEKLSMRTLGSALGVEAMSLYNHVQGKDAILDGVVETMLGEFPVAEAPDPDWRVRLARGARAFRALALEHPNAFPLFARRPARSWQSARHLVEAELARLIDSGFTPDDAVRVQRIALRYVIGFCLSDAASAADRSEGRPAGAPTLDQEGFPLVNRLLGSLAEPDADELFELGLSLLVAGIDSWRAGGNR